MTDLSTRNAAKRTGLILTAIFGTFFLLAIVWVVPEARRISRERGQRLAEARTGADMVRIPAGGITMGSNEGPTEEQPLHDIKVSEFWMDRSEVTNEQFERFVKSTGYVTTAERPRDGKQAGSWVFRRPAQPWESWKVWIPGASWRAPEGPGSDVGKLAKHPVVHVSHEDALAYAKWSGKRLPTEAEWEFAARGGEILLKYPWGREASPSGMFPANTWQGAFPEKNEISDGFAGTAPAGSFAPNNYGVVDLAGNVAEWCSDWFSAAFYAELRPDPNRAAHRNPQGPDTSSDPSEPGVWKRVVRGGSWLSGPMDFRVAARGREVPDFTASWIGFRCVRDVPAR